MIHVKEICHNDVAYSDTGAQVEFSKAQFGTLWNVGDTEINIEYEGKKYSTIITVPEKGNFGAREYAKRNNNISPLKNLFKDILKLTDKNVGTILMFENLDDTNKNFQLYVYKPKLKQKNSTDDNTNTLDDDTQKSNIFVKNAIQQIYYGTPGTGKSYEVKKRTGEIDDAGKEYSLPNVFRTTFHPDTDYASFVGCYKPIEKKAVKYGLNGNSTIPFTDSNGDSIKEDYISYVFEPQVFTEAYVYAYNHPNVNTYLVIEEINRGNCAQIFGDLFQLLDRKADGTSEYKIKADSSLAKYLRESKDENGNFILVNQEGIADGKLCLPPNLSILATMNTSDQSLFPMDAAFKRRWDWKYVPIRYDEEKSSEFMIEIGSHRYNWVTFLQAVNPRIKTITSSEDKMMGNFFIKSDIDAEKFKSKVMFYLWNEILKDEVENNNYFLYGKNGDEKQKFMFSDLYDSNANDTLVAFMKTLNVDDEKIKDYGNGAQESDPWYKSLWTEVTQKLNENGYNKFTAAPDSQYYQKGIGITGMSVIASVSKKSGSCWVGAYIEAKQADILYPKVKEKKNDLEAKLGSLQWKEDGGAYRRISLENKFDDLNDESNRNKAIDWMVDKLQNFYDKFKEVVADIRKQ